MAASRVISGRLAGLSRYLALPFLASSADAVQILKGNLLVKETDRLAVEDGGFCGLISGEHVGGSGHAQESSTKAVPLLGGKVAQRQT